MHLFLVYALGPGIGKTCALDHFSNVLEQHKTTIFGTTPVHLLHLNITFNSGTPLLPGYEYIPAEVASRIWAAFFARRLATSDFTKRLNSSQSNSYELVLATFVAIREHMLASGQLQDDQYLVVNLGVDEFSTFKPDSLKSLVLTLSSCFFQLDTHKIFVIISMAGTEFVPLGDGMRLRI